MLYQSFWTLKISDDKNFWTLIFSDQPWNFSIFQFFRFSGKKSTFQIIFFKKFTKSQQIKRVNFQDHEMKNDLKFTDSGGKSANHVFTPAIRGKGKRQDGVLQSVQKTIQEIFKENLWQLVWQLVSQIVLTIFICNNHIPFHLLQKKHLERYLQVQKHYGHSCKFQKWHSRIMAVFNSNKTYFVLVT